MTAIACVRQPQAHELRPYTKLAQLTQRIGVLHNSVSCASLREVREIAMPLDIETRDQLLETVRRFVREKCVPIEGRVGDEDRVPDSIIVEMRKLGLFGLSIPIEYGGLGLTMEEEVLVAIELGHTSPAFRSVIGTNVGIGSQGVVMFGTDAQKQEWLPKLASGEVVASFALTEPNAGSDAASVRTTAIADGVFRARCANST